MPKGAGCGAQLRGAGSEEVLCPNFGCIFHNAKVVGGFGGWRSRTAKPVEVVEDLVEDLDRLEYVLQGCMEDSTK